MILTSAAEIRALLERTKRVAVLGIKTESQADQPAFYVPAYAKQVGLEIVPVAVYYPDVGKILGEPVYRTLAAIPGPLDLVDVFRRPKDLEAHKADILEKMPRAVWLQSGIRDDAFASALSKRGIDVVQDRCLMVELRAYRASIGAS